MKVGLIDDESDARATLRMHLTDLRSNFTFFEASGVSTGLSLLKDQQPELVFLDVMMQDGTGFDLLRQLPTIDFKLVIVSGHDEFALQAFRFSAIDYLVKPVDADELRSTMERIMASSRLPWDQMLDVLKQSIQPQKEADRKIVLKDLHSVYVVSIKSVTRCESFDNYTTFHLIDQNPITVSKPLKEFDELLSSFGFIRVHQSHLINLEYLQQFNKREGGSIRMKDGCEVPVSSRKRDAILKALSNFG